MSIDPRRIESPDDETVRRLRAMTPVERVKAGLRLGAFARAIIAAGVRQRHPDWNPEQVRQETLRRFRGG